VIANSTEHNTEQNPFTAETKKQMISKTLEHYGLLEKTDINTT